jgi:hypothetical protein
MSSRASRVAGAAVPSAPSSFCTQASAAGRVVATDAAIDEDAEPIEVDDLAERGDGRRLHPLVGILHHAEHLGQSGRNPTPAHDLEEHGQRRRTG